MKRRWVLLGVAGVLAGGCAGSLTFCAGPPSYYSEKFGPSPVPLRLPSPTPGDFAPETQTEPHTCGLHSMNVIYRAYGLNPDDAKLRFRLGTDIPVNLFAPGTTGTIHPDILRVLEQDGFTSEVLVANEELASRLESHLTTGHPAMVLVKASTWHWVVACGIDEKRNVTICDSLKPETYQEPLGSYAADRAQSVLLIRPR